MNSISLHNTLPHIFQLQESVISEIWNQPIVFEKGKYYLIQANSGTGKSSLCSYMYGYREDYNGKILFDQNDIRQFPLKKWDDIRTHQLSLLFQELCLFPELTAMENIELKNNLTRYKSKPEIASMFEALGISDKKDALISKMSWGQQQRVAIIRCLCQPFDFLILDEPVSHLDEENATIVAGLIADEVNRQGAGMIVTSIGKDLPVTYTHIFSL